MAGTAADRGGRSSDTIPDSELRNVENDIAAKRQGGELDQQ